MRASSCLALAFVSLAAACADVQATVYDAGALSPIGQGGDGGVRGGAGSMLGRRRTEKGSPGAAIDGSLPPSSDGGGASSAPVPGPDGGSNT